MSENTLLLRLEGPLQSWGDQESKFVVRRTGQAPTKSGIMGLFCAAMGVSRADARKRLAQLNDLRMGVRVDRSGVRWWDYHTVGAGMQMRIAEREGKTKPGAMLTRREYLCDASFLVAMQGDCDLIGQLRVALLHPVWPVYLGRKSCPASLPLLGRKDEPDVGEFSDLELALRSVPWRRRTGDELAPDGVDCLLEWPAAQLGDVTPGDAEVWYDVARSFDVPGHEARFVVRKRLSIGVGKEIAVGTPRQSHTPAPPRARADYGNTEYRKRRQQRLEADDGLCVFCKSPATTVQHITYRRAGGDEAQEDLRSLCRLCHDAVTMIEYGLGMGLDRINPEDLQYRDQIIRKRAEIIAFRSLETRRRRLKPEEVE
ncbi:MAG: type I-E CRISPR-associated protein Cas5/CasD [Planctomycetota bacterium]|nr:type I-E CRISPR-associated protein Cas5/CasD [Planctomycetota bacterium]